MLLQITHQTRYDYQPDVAVAQHMAYLQPLQHPGQQLLAHQLTVSPEPAQQTMTTDVYGNARCFFSLQSSHAVLDVQAMSMVRTQANVLPVSTEPWEALRDRLHYQANQPYDPASEFVFASPYVPRHPEFEEYARPSMKPGVSMLAVAVDLMQRIHHEFTYESESTQVNTPALTALAQRKGVCQDFAHIMLASLRAVGLPARYVSGYLLTLPPPGQVKLQGSDASHAWVSVYVGDLPEGLRWVDLDPTNNRWGWYSPGEDYVTVATGRDFGDVSPLRGVLRGGAGHTLTVGVTVADIGEDTGTTSTPSALATSSQSQTQAQGTSQIQGQNQSQSQSQSQNQSQYQNSFL
jgi:transglutaminase-like putative cysteine protease